MSDHGLTLRQAFFGDPVAHAAYAALMDVVFDIDVPARDAFCGPDSTCRPVALFDATGLCVASAEVFAVPLVVDGTRCEAAGLRSVAVHPDWRGRGLFREVMTAILAWCDATVSGPVLLYSAESALYERFGFLDVPQHRFAGPAPAVSAETASGRILSLDDEDDMTLVRCLLATRTPVSDQVAVDGGTVPFLTQLDGTDDFTLHYLVNLDTLVVSTGGAGTFTIVDVVAAQIPSAAAILAGLGVTPKTLRVLFPPDKLDWAGRATRDDTGLMIRGPAPAAFARPFMLPPTAEF